MQFGGRDVTRAQLNHLVETSKEPHITLRVIPSTAPRSPPPAMAWTALTAP
ncbi:Scr1 family TA system antitoxin-like transcriptional regulator [Streptomyces sp. NBC_00996]|uniref:Scr1 family TA system antitoxin-like transcriptional regulator n=1 Tax=Streptomyces sp. NBC_00996 TaxID=2903710 RepID=UPI003869107C|nr:DUF5753 domain-containing protein [Streptomyces sp. NBC_00996]